MTSRTVTRTADDDEDDSDPLADGEVADDAQDATDDVGGVLGDTEESIGRTSAVDPPVPPFVPEAMERLANDVGRVAPPDLAALVGELTALAQDALKRLVGPPLPSRLPALPADPLGSLIRAANEHSASLGVRVDHSRAIRKSGIPPEYAGRLALLLRAVLDCRDATSPALRRDCSEATGEAANAVLRTRAPAFRDVDAWPTLHVDGDGGGDDYRHDYAALVDRGGDDTYDNNAGGNLMDVERGPRSSAAPETAPAVGCEQVTGNFPSPALSGHDCIAAPQVALIDERDFGSGDDRYGVLRPPRRSDHNPPASGSRRVDGDCTRDQLVRRMVVQGSGFEGNGLLMDVGGDDVYRGKTSAQGAGHVGGIGVLRDLGGGDDRYLAIRNSQGFGLVGVLGLLHDDGGSDRYETYMPRPLRPDAQFQADGSGGVVDDTGVCDGMSRMVQGTALLGGAGSLLDEDGADRYAGAPDGVQDFARGVQFFHASQGFGCSGGYGSLRDEGGDHDVYRNGPEDRSDGRSTDEVQEGCRPAAPGASHFSDDGG